LIWGRGGGGGGGFFFLKKILCLDDFVSTKILEFM
jgi:hypothetical protein